MGRKATILSHPALAYMIHEARGYLEQFQTDLTKHDALALSQHEHTNAFAWIVWPTGTHICFTGTASNPTHERTTWWKGFARMVTEAMGADVCRYYFWDGYKLSRIKCAADLDERFAQHEQELADARERGRLADLGVM